MKRIGLLALFAALFSPIVTSGAALAGVGSSSLPVESAAEVDAPTLPADMLGYLLRFCPDDDLRNLGRANPQWADLILRCPDLGAEFVRRDARARGLYAIDSVLKSHKRDASSAAFAPDGATIAIATWSQERRDGRALPIEIHFFSLATRELVRTITAPVVGPLPAGPWDGPLWYPSNLTFSHDGSRLAFSLSSDALVVVVDATDGHTLNVYDTPTMSSMALSPDGSRLATTAMDGTLRIYDLASDEFLALGSDAGETVGVKFLPDGARVVAATTDGAIRLWDAATGAQIRSFDQRPQASSVSHAIEPSAPTALAVSPDGSLVAATCADDNARIWLTATGELLRILAAPFREKSWYNRLTGPSIDFSPDGTRLAISVHNGPIELWDVKSAKQEPIVILANSGAELRFSPDGNHIASLSTVDRSAGVMLRTLAPILYKREGFSSPAYSYLRSGGIAERSDSPGATPPIARSLAYTIDNFDESIASIAFSPTGDQLALASPSSIQIVRPNTGAIERTIRTGATRDARNREGSITFSKNGMELVTSIAMGRTTSFDPHSGKTLRSFSTFTVAPQNFRLTAQFLHGGETFLERTASGYWLCEGYSGARIGRFESGNASFFAVSPDSTLLASRAPNGDVVTIYDSSSRARVATLVMPLLRQWTTPLREASAAAFSKTDADGTKIAVAFQNILGVWRAETGQLMRELRVPSEPRETVTALAFSPDGSLVVAGFRDNSIRVWDANAAQEVASYVDAGDESGITKLAFSPDGKHLASASGGRLTVRSAADTSRSDARSRGN